MQDTRGGGDGGSYPFAKMQSVYSIAWAGRETSFGWEM